MSATSDLLSFALALDPATLPQPVLRMAARCVLDLVGVAIAGTATDMSRISTSFALAQFGEGPATVIGSPRRLAVTGAVWANGIAASALDLDDGNRMAMGHPGAAVIPAALAVAEARGASGPDLLSAIVAGYEVAVRASASRVPWYKDDQYSTGIWGVLGAAVAAGRLLGFDLTHLQSALGNAASHGPFPPAGIAANDSMTKEVIGWAGMTGSAAALLAERGFKGPADVLDYSQRWDTQELVRDLGTPGRYAILQTYFKPYAVCRWAHSAIDATLDLVSRHNLSPGQVEKITVETFYAASRVWNYAPSTVVSAQYSVPFALAAAVLFGQVGPRQVIAPNLTNPAILDLMRRVDLVIDPEMEAQFPAKTIARVTIQTPSGAHQATVEYPRGNPENPLSEQELSAKFCTLAEEIVGPARAEALRQACLDLPAARDMRGLTDLLRFQSGDAA